MNCEYCGSRTFEDERSCSKCGAPASYRKPKEFDSTRMSEHYNDWRIPQDELQVPDPVPVNKVSYKSESRGFPGMSVSVLFIMAFMAFGPHQFGWGWWIIWTGLLWGCVVIDFDI